jgi:hypothetical protein
MKKTIISAVITVITGVAIYWLTTGWKSSPPTPETSVLDGRVFDQASMRLLEGVAVSVQVQGNTTLQTQTTDSDGRYLIQIPRTQESQAAKILATAAGYASWQRYLTANASGMFESPGDIALREQPKPPPGVAAVPPGGVRPAAPKVSQTLILSATPYQRRPLSQALKISIPAVKH